MSSFMKQKALVEMEGIDATKPKKQNKKHKQKLRGKFTVNTGSSVGLSTFVVVVFILCSVHFV